MKENITVSPATTPLTGNQGHNGEIDFWKFVASIIIVLHHSYSVFDTNRIYFAQGSLIVEFFFIISGYFMARSALKKNTYAKGDMLGKETVGFVIKKIRNIFPYYLFSCITILLANILQKGFSETINLNMLKTPFSFLFLNTTGIPDYNIVGSSWYLSAMFLAIMILYPLLRKNSDIFINIIAPMLTVFLYGLMMHKDGIIVAPDIWYWFADKGFVRAIAGMSAGCIVFNLSEKLKVTIISKKISILLSVLELSCMLASIIILYNNMDSSYQPFVLLLFFISIIIMASEKGLLNRLFKSSSFKYLGKLSMAIFLTHPVCTRLISYATDTFFELKIFRALEYGPPVFAAVLVEMAVILGVICIAICDSIEKKIKNRAIKDKSNSDKDITVSAC